MNGGLLRAAIEPLNIHAGRFTSCNLLAPLIYSGKFAETFRVDNNADTALR